MRIGTSVKLDGVLCVTTVPRNSRAWGLATSVFCPQGKSPTRAWVLMSKADATALDGTTTHSLEWAQQAADGAVATTLTFSGLYLVSARRLLHGGVDDPSALYLVELADSRWKCAERDCGQITANLRSYANDADYLTGTSGYTWTSLLTELWSACGTLGAFPGLPGGLPIDGVPQNTWLIGLSAWDSLCAVLEQLDCVVDHDPLTNTYTIVQLGGAQVIPANTDTLIWDEQPVSYSTPAATIRLYYHYHRKSYGQERDVELANNWAYNGAGSSETIATGIANAAGTKPLWDDLPWILDEDNADFNASDRATRLENRKDRYVARVGVADEHKIFGGLHDNIVTGGKIRAVLWRNYGDTENRLGGTVTEYRAQADPVMGLKQAGMGVQAEEGGGYAYAAEQYAPPALGRQGYPSYPRLPNIVQVRNAGASAGDTVSPNADGFHPGKVRRWTANAMTVEDDCWIRFVDQHDDLDGQVTARNYDLYGPARLSGVSTSGGSRLPVYTVRRGESAAVVRFRLTAPLETGSSAAAVIRTFAAGNYVDGDAIVVFDWWAISQGGRGMWQGFTNMEGWAFKREENATPAGDPEYDIIWMEQYAFWIEGTLTSGFSEGGVATGTVDASWHQGVEPGASVTVHDDHEGHMFPQAREGAKFSAARSEYADPTNPDEPYYKVIQCQQVALTGKAILGEIMCNSGVFAISGFVVTSFSPFNLDIHPESAFNDYALMGEPGDPVWLEWDDTLEAYMITQVLHKELDVVTDIRLQGSYIQANIAKCAMMYCEPPEWIDKIPVEDCEEPA